MKLAGTKNQGMELHDFDERLRDMTAFVESEQQVQARKNEEEKEREKEREAEEKITYPVKITITGIDGSDYSITIAKNGGYLDEHGFPLLRYEWPFFFGDSFYRLKHQIEEEYGIPICRQHLFKKDGNSEDEISNSEGFEHTNYKNYLNLLLILDSFPCPIENNSALQNFIELYYFEGLDDPEAEGERKEKENLINNYGTIDKWDTSNITNMEDLFSHTENFNDDISEWDTSNVTNMDNMFDGAEKFNQDISNWNVENVTSFNNIFRGCPIKNEFKPPKFR